MEKTSAYRETHICNGQEAKGGWFSLGITSRKGWSLMLKGGNVSKSHMVIPYAKQKSHNRHFMSGFKPRSDSLEVKCLYFSL